jgi:hypothetical protein
MEMSLVQALLQDVGNCASVPFGEESLLCVLNHPEQFREERVGYYIVVQEAGLCVFKDVLQGYETLLLYLRHAGISVEEGWKPAGERLADLVRSAIFSLYVFK